MTIEKAIRILLENFIRAKDDVGIRKPVSFALYLAWKYSDRHEKERKGTLD